MATFKVTKTTTVAELKNEFQHQVGGLLRVYNGRSEAADDSTLVSLGAKEGVLECRTSRTVGKFEEAFQTELNLKVKVYTKDNWVKVLDGITLATVKDLPNGMTKAKMEEYLAYKRDEEVPELAEDAEKEDTDASTYVELPSIEEFTEERTEAAINSQELVVVLSKSSLTYFDELIEQVEGELLAIVGYSNGRFHYIGDSETIIDAKKEVESIGLENIYFITENVYELDRLSPYINRYGTFLPENDMAYYSGEHYPDGDNDVCFVMAEVLTGDETGHVWNCVTFDAHKIFVYDNNIIAEVD